MFSWQLLYPAPVTEFLGSRNLFSKQNGGAFIVVASGPNVQIYFLVSPQETSSAGFTV